MSKEWIDEYMGKTSAGRINNASQIGFAKKLMVQDFIEPMIGTGDERDSFKDLVDEYTQRFDSLDFFELQHWYFDVSYYNSSFVYL